uniref:Uncharacterized protein n=1 Tax=Anopheles darlingi TaxID=43151 RepID=A0A2M4D322_ANODA
MDHAVVRVERCVAVMIAVRFVVLAPRIVSSAMIVDRFVVALIVRMIAIVVVVVREHRAVMTDRVVGSSDAMMHVAMTHVGRIVVRVRRALVVVNGRMCGVVHRPVTREEHHRHERKETGERQHHRDRMRPNHARSAHSVSNAHRKMFHHATLDPMRKAGRMW